MLSLVRNLAVLLSLYDGVSVEEGEERYVVDAASREDPKVRELTQVRGNLWVGGMSFM